MFRLARTNGRLIGGASGLAIGLGVLAGILNGLNTSNAFVIAEPWKQLLAAALILVGGLGVAPIAGPQLRNLLHMSTGLAAALSTALVALAGAIETFSLAATTKGILIGVISLVATVLYGSVGFVPAPVVPTPAPPAAGTARR